MAKILTATCKTCGRVDIDSVLMLAGDGWRQLVTPGLENLPPRYVCPNCPDPTPKLPSPVSLDGRGAGGEGASPDALSPNSQLPTPD